jgi:hypothetical protein
VVGAEQGRQACPECGQPVRGKEGLDHRVAVAPNALGVLGDIELG